MRAHDEAKAMPSVTFGYDDFKESKNSLVRSVASVNFVCKTSSGKEIYGDINRSNQRAPGSLAKTSVYRIVIFDEIITLHAPSEETPASLFAIISDSYKDNIEELKKLGRLPDLTGLTEEEIENEACKLAARDLRVIVQSMSQMESQPVCAYITDAVGRRYPGSYVEPVHAVRDLCFPEVQLKVKETDFIVVKDGVSKEIVAKIFGECNTEYEARDFTVDDEHDYQIGRAEVGLASAREALETETDSEKIEIRKNLVEKKLKELEQVKQLKESKHFLSHEPRLLHLKHLTIPKVPEGHKSLIETLLSSKESPVFDEKQFPRQFKPGKGIFAFNFNADLAKIQKAWDKTSEEFKVYKSKKTRNAVGWFLLGVLLLAPTVIIGGLLCFIKMRYEFKLRNELPSVKFDTKEGEKVTINPPAEKGALPTWAYDESVAEPRRTTIGQLDSRRMRNGKADNYRKRYLKIAGRFLLAGLAIAAGVTIGVMTGGLAWIAGGVLCAIGAVGLKKLGAEIKGTYDYKKELRGHSEARRKVTAIPASDPSIIDPLEYPDDDKVMGLDENKALLEEVRRQEKDTLHDTRRTQSGNTLNFARRLSQASSSDDGYEPVGSEFEGASILTATHDGDLSWQPVVDDAHPGIVAPSATSSVVGGVHKRSGQNTVRFAAQSDKSKKHEDEDKEGDSDAPSRGNSKKI